MLRPDETVHALGLLTDTSRQCLWREGSAIVTDVRFSYWPRGCRPRDGTLVTLPIQDVERSVHSRRAIRGILHIVSSAGQVLRFVGTKHETYELHAALTRLRGHVPDLGTTFLRATFDSFNPLLVCAHCGSHVGATAAVCPTCVRRVDRGVSEDAVREYHRALERWTFGIRCSDVV